MEARKITVVQTRNQKKSVVMTAATTLGELKEALDEAGINYDGMTFYEGLSKTELKQDSSILPHDIERNGTVTNELVFMLTNTDKKIRSGAMLRPELYTYIKTNNLQAEVQRKFGKNFTMCKTADLQSVVDAHVNSKPAVLRLATGAPTVKKEPKAEVKTEVNVAPADSTTGIKTAFMMLLDDLYENDYIDLSVKDEILDVLNHEPGTYPESNEAVKDDMSSPYSDAEIARMMREM